MHSRFIAFAAVVAACVSSASAGSAYAMPAVRAGRVGAVLRMRSASGDDEDKHTDPDTVHGTGKKFLSCEDLRMSLRGGAPMAEVSANPLKIVFVSAEIAPWSITGGLGAVCDGLPRALAKAGHRVMSIAPRYDQYFDAWDTEFTATVPLGEGTTTVRFFHAYKKGVDRVFVDHPLFLERVWGLSKQKLYGPKWGKDYEDNQLRFSMLCHAALAATEKLKLGGHAYGQDVTFVANDWHAALVPMYLKMEQSKGQWKDAKSAILLHNLVFQGRFPYDANAAKRLRLSDELVQSMKVTQVKMYNE